MFATEDHLIKQHENDEIEGVRLNHFRIISASS